jgi:hypothetical protein
MSCSLSSHDPTSRSYVSSECQMLTQAPLPPALAVSVSPSMHVTTNTLEATPGPPVSPLRYGPPCEEIKGLSPLPLIRR